jgi:hypothetical protein
MSVYRLSPEQRQAVCEDLLCIINAGRRQEVVSLRRRLAREHRPASPWQELDADHIAREAAAIVGGSPGHWRAAAAAALGITSRFELGIEAVATVADEVREQESQRVAPLYRATLGSRKRGSR